MDEVRLFVALLSAVVLVALFAQRAQRVPREVALVLAGLAVGLLPFAPEVELSPELIFLVFLPPIIYPSSYLFAHEDLRASLRQIGGLSIGLVLTTMGGIAAALHIAAGIPWGAAFVLGAVLAPTDPVAATALIRSTGAPPRLATILEGESLINDGTAVTAFRVAVGTIGTTFSVAPAAGKFLLVAGGGALIGTALGWATAQLRRRLDDLQIESTVAVLLAYGSFVLAEELGTSGILATVMAGIVMGLRSHGETSASSRTGGASFWGVALFLGESILFLLVGLAFAQALDAPGLRGGWELAGLALLVVVVALLSRLLWMFTVPYLGGLFDPQVRRLRATEGVAERLVLSFGGMRGAVSVASALSIPLTAGGAPFPERPTLIAVSLTAIVALLLVPALLLPWLVRVLGLAGTSQAAEQERHARAALIRAALRRADELAVDAALPGGVLDLARDRLEWRLERLSEQPDADGDDAVGAAYREVSRELLDAQRAELAELRSRGEATGGVLRAIEHDLDLEEARIG